MKMLDSTFFILPSSLGEWLPDMDLNHDKVIQSHLCYRYTIGQTDVWHSLDISLSESRN